MSHLDRHDAGQLLDHALRLRLAAHGLKSARAKRPFLRHAKAMEKRALLLLGADVKFQSALPDEIRPT